VTLEKRVKPWIAALAPYQPGQADRGAGARTRHFGRGEARLEREPARALAARDRSVQRALAGVHRYPDGASFALRSKLVERLAVAPEQLVFGCGADELLELVAKAFLGPGDEAVFRVAVVRDVPDRDPRHGCHTGSGAARRRPGPRPGRDGGRDHRAQRVS